MVEGAAGHLTLRPARATDRGRLAEVYLDSRLAAVPLMPPPAHSAVEVRAWVAGWDLVAREVWVSEEGDDLVGFASLEDDWLDGLYVAPRRTRSGIGSALIEVVQAVRPGGFGLWVFESNTAARAFYAGHGLVEAEHTDGRDNEERSPDLRMVWPGTTPARSGAAAPARPAPAPRPGRRTAAPR